MDVKSLDSDWKGVLSWQACFDLIVSKIMTPCDLWFDFESDMKTWAKIRPWEEIEKSLVLIIVERPNLITKEGTEVWWVENKKVIQMSMRIFDHDCSLWTVALLHDRDSSPYFTLQDLKENGGN